ncbi:hypothetical protein QGM71_12190 [Virgibacillus sp. C22-A2]|uniref:DUF4145 domain-containing protein n=1 Tax=Virgibacillus tibetensis TaxID=3042313 RepID=A0ABU6KG10_9BACI|nr:hypothetical protein [Virgibacillus sp. C22-A2]
MLEDKLISVASNYFNDSELQRIDSLSSNPHFDNLLTLDREIGGIGIFNINNGRTGRYHVEDRDILRPLQYIYMNLELRENSLSWFTRDIIHMCGLHLESIIKRCTRKYRTPLGKSLYDKKLIKILDARIISELGVIAKLFNAAKHEVSSYKDEHLFSIKDALYCYFITRKLASELYRHVELYTSPEVWTD